MKIDFYFETDGDFTLDMEYLIEQELKNGGYLETVKYEYLYDGEECIEFKAEITQQNNYPVEALTCDLIGAVIKSIRFHHMFLMQDLYDTYEALCEWIYHIKREKEYTYCWYGNYTGTKWTIIR